MIVLHITFVMSFGFILSPVTAQEKVSGLGSRGLIQWNLDSAEGQISARTLAVDQGQEAARGGAAGVGIELPGRRSVHVHLDDLAREYLDQAQGPVGHEEKISGACHFAGTAAFPAQGFHVLAVGGKNLYFGELLVQQVDVVFLVDQGAGDDAQQHILVVFSADAPDLLEFHGLDSIGGGGAVDDVKNTIDHHLLTGSGGSANQGDGQKENRQDRECLGH